MTRIIIRPEGLALTNANQSSQLNALVQDEVGSTIPKAVVTWHSSEPQVVRISQDGLVTALSDVGYAMITAEFKGTISQPVPVTVVKLALKSRLLDAKQVQSTSEGGNAAVLVLDEVTASLGIGDIIISEAIFGRVTQIDVLEREVRVRTEIPSIPEAFESIMFRVRYREGPYSGRIDPR